MYAEKPSEQNLIYRNRSPSLVHYQVTVGAQLLNVDWLLSY